MKSVINVHDRIDHLHERLDHLSLLSERPESDQP
jgi:hypothetical protein